MTLDSMSAWLASWGEGPNWSDPTGATVPITKAALHDLLVKAAQMRTALLVLKERALCRAPGAVAEFSPAAACSIAITCEDALEGV